MNKQYDIISDTAGHIHEDTFARLIRDSHPEGISTDMVKDLAMKMKHASSAMQQAVERESGTSFLKDLSFVTMLANPGTWFKQNGDFLAIAEKLGFDNFASGLQKVASRYGDNIQKYDLMGEALGKTQDLINNVQIANSDDKIKKAWRKFVELAMKPMHGINQLTMGTAEQALLDSITGKIANGRLSEVKERIMQLGWDEESANRIIKDLVEVSKYNSGKIKEKRSLSSSTYGYVASELDEIQAMTLGGNVTWKNMAKGTPAELLFVLKSYMLNRLGVTYMNTLHQISKGYKTGNMKMVKEGYKRMGTTLAYVGVGTYLLDKTWDYAANKKDKNEYSVQDFALSSFANSLGLNKYFVESATNGQSRNAVAGMFSPPVLGVATNVVEDVRTGIKATIDPKYQWITQPGSRTYGNLPFIGFTKRWVFSDGDDLRRKAREDKALEKKRNALSPF